MCAYINSDQRRFASQSTLQRPSFLENNIPLTKPRNIRNIQNYDFKQYQILRENIIDKVEEVIRGFSDPRSSLQIALHNIFNSRRVDPREKKQIRNILQEITNDADNLLSLDNSDHQDFFNLMNDFTKSLKTLRDVFEVYIYKTDSIDIYNIQEPIETLKRFSREFRQLERTENSFPGEFRQAYVNSFAEKNFY